MIYFSKEHKGRDRHPGVFCPELNKCLEKFKDIIGAIPKKQLPSGWVRDFLKLLNAMGWSKGRKLSSEEFQTVNAWNEALQKFSVLDTVGGELDIHSAISLLTQNINVKNFQPETDDVPVQIMGMLEAVGERFDHAWIMGLDAESWPPAPRPKAKPLAPVRKVPPPRASLSGVIRIGDNTYVMLKGVGKEKGLLRVKVGEDVDGWQVEKIQDDRVVLNNAGEKHEIPLRSYKTVPLPRVKPPAKPGEKDKNRAQERKKALAARRERNKQPK